MSDQPRYLFRGPRPGPPVQAEGLRVRHPEVVEVVRNLDWGASEVRGTGKVDRKLLRISMAAGRILAATGMGSTARHDFAEVSCTAAAVKGVVRRLRDEEAADLDALDEQIAEVKARLEALREERTAKVKQAWTRAHVVRLADVESLLPDS